MISFPQNIKICYRITVSGIETATRAHLHMGDAGERNDAVKLNLHPLRTSARECVKGPGRSLRGQLTR